MAEYELNADQRRAVDACERVSRHDRWFKIDGAAGTGKTYIAPHVARRLDAVQVIGTTVSHVARKILAKKLRCECQTVAALFYRHELQETPASARARRLLEERVGRSELVRDSKEYHRALKIDVERWMKDAFVLNPDGKFNELGKRDLLIVDEHSMVKPEIRALLERHSHCRIGLFGDSFQLPPPGVSHGAFETMPTTYELTETVRGLGTNIPEIAVRFRRGTPRFSDGHHGQFVVATSECSGEPFSMLGDQQWRFCGNSADIVIAPHHRTRMLATVNIRRVLFGCGLDRPLINGDRFLVRRRHKCGLENSMLLTLGREIVLPPADAEPPPEGYLRVDIVDRDLLEMIWKRRARDEGLKPYPIPFDLPPEPLIFPVSMLAWSYHDGTRHNREQWVARAKKEVEFYQDHLGEEITTVLEYAWAVTVHSIQGAEFDRIVLLYCGWGDNPSDVEARRLVYTAITRARRSAVLVRSSRFLF